MADPQADRVQAHFKAANKRQVDAILQAQPHLSNSGSLPTCGASRAGMWEATVETIRDLEGKAMGEHHFVAEITKDGATRSI
jgi:hypothetical protein